MTAVVTSILTVRRSIHIAASPTRVWEEFTTFERMNRWWGVMGGTLVELMHHGFERTGDHGADEHEGYESGWGLTQLSALRRLVAVQ